VPLIQRLFLRAKHWQLFLLLAGVVVGCQIALVSTFPTSNSPEDFAKALRTVGAATLALVFLMASWFWGLGSFLNALVPLSGRPPIRVFRLALIYPAAYAVVFFCVLWLTQDVPAVIFPFHLLATGCMFYNLYFVAKSLTLAETGRTAASFYDFSGPFFLLWFFPLGIWVIQPRINRLFDAWQRAQQPHP
jgi:hypothetical protein